MAWSCLIRKIPSPPLLVSACLPWRPGCRSPSAPAGSHSRFPAGPAACTYSCCLPCNYSSSYSAGNSWPLKGLFMKILNLMVKSLLTKYDYSYVLCLVFVYLCLAVRRSCSSSTLEPRILSSSALIFSSSCLFFSSFCLLSSSPFLCASRASNFLAKS